MSAPVVPIKAQYPQGPKLCDCRHSKYVHRDCFRGACVKEGCSCQKYVKAK